MSRSASDSLVKIARVLKSHGTDGAFAAGFTGGFAADDIDLTEPVFIIFDGLPVPFFIESIVPKGTGKAIMRITGVKSFEDAEEIAGRDVFVCGDAENPADFHDDFSMLTGWTLFAAGEDGDTEIGTVTDFIDIPGNPCIEAKTKKGAVTIPLHEDLILSVNPDAREIIMDIPDGLLSV